MLSLNTNDYAVLHTLVFDYLDPIRSAPSGFSRDQILARIARLTNATPATVKTHLAVSEEVLYLATRQRREKLIGRNAYNRILSIAMQAPVLLLAELAESNAVNTPRGAK